MGVTQTKKDGTGHLIVISKDFSIAVIIEGVNKVEKDIS